MLSARYQLLCVILSSTYFFGQYAQSQVVDPIVIKGSKFFYQNNGSQFFIKGMIYQQANGSDDRGTVAINLQENIAINLLTDSLSEPSGCIRDVPYLKDLHTNVVRTYFIDSSLDHAKCMAVFAQAGIYVMVDLMAPAYLISDVNPIWNNVLYSHYTSVIDIMHNYTNLLGFILGDDVIGGISQNGSGPYVKAAVRDMKAYIRQKSYRPIPVGYVNLLFNDTTISDYLNCGDKIDDNIDFLGENMMGACTNNSDSPFWGKTETSALSTYSVPVFLVERGCPVDPHLREFWDIDVIYGQLMSPVWSGGIYYQYFSTPSLEEHDFGFGLVKSDRYNNSSPVVGTASYYQNLSRHLATVSPSSINWEKYIPTNTAAACPVRAALSLPPNPIAVSLTASLPRTSADTVSATASSPRTSASSITPTPKSANDALSTGGKVGIGLGLAILVLALVLGFLFIQKGVMEKKRIGRDPWAKTELAADDIDPEARGYGPHMAASTPRAEVDGSGVMREVQADNNEIFEAPGDLPALPELSARHPEIL